MPISFEEIPADILTPGNFVEIDPTGAIEGTGVRPHTALVIGYRLAAGTVAENIPKQVTSDEQAEGFWGQASQVATMVMNFRKANPRTSLVGIGVDEAAGTPATGTFTLTGTATAAGTAQFYIAGVRYPVGVAVGDTNIEVGTALVTAVNADPRAQVVAADSGPPDGIVTITYRHDGPEGNDIDIQINFRDADILPAGLSNVTAPMASGATSPNLAATITALAGTQYDTIVSGIADDSNIDLLEAELDTRWGPMVNLDGHLFVGFVGDFSASKTFTEQPARNSEQSTVVTPGLTPTPPWTVAANLAAIDAFETQQDPARPRTTLVLPDVVAPKSGSRFDQSERNLLLGFGAATTFVNASGQVAIERITTTYQKNAQGIDDPTWLDLSTKRTVSFLRWSWDARLTLKYPRHKLADDGTRFSPGQAIVTPSTIRAEALAWFEDQELAGLVEDLAQFRTDLVIERNVTDFNRLDAILRPDVLNKFVVSATRLQPRL